MTDTVLGVGATYDRGRYRTDERLSGHSSRGIYGGRRVADDLPVLISVRQHSWNPQLVDSLRFEVPGVAPLLFIGPPDGYRAPRPNVPTRLAAVIEARPSGTPLARCRPPVAAVDLVRIGIGLVSTAIAAAERQVEIQGIRRETVYVVDHGAGLELGGVAPRSIRVLRHHNDPPYGTPFDGHSYDAPELYSPGEASATSDLFSIALTLWAAFTGAHPYRVSAGDVDEGVMLADDRGPFPGPAELGRILESILVADPARRPSLTRAHDELLALARLWGVAPASFPPPIGGSG